MEKLPKPPKYLSKRAKKRWKEIVSEFGIIDSPLVEHGGHGGSVAAPITKEIIDTYARLTGREVAMPQTTRATYAQESHAD